MMKKEFIEICQSNGLLIKFGTKDNLKKLQSGNIYMKNLKYYNDLESEYGGKPDKKDGKYFLNNVNIEMIDPKTRKTIIKGRASQLLLSVGYDKFPIYCLFSMDSRNIVGEYCVEECNKTIRFKTGFTCEQKEKIKKELGEYAVVILDSGKFLDLINNKLQQQKVTMKKGFVEYYSANEFNYSYNALSNIESIPYMKEKDKFAYQNEFRILITNRPTDDHFEIDIGDITKITKLLPTEDLLQIMFDFNASYIEK